MKESRGRRTHLSEQVAVKDLKHFIEAKLAESLHGVADEGGGPALGQASDAVLLHGYGKTIADALVLVWVHLKKKKKSTVRTRHFLSFFTPAIWRVVFIVSKWPWPFRKNIFFN